MTSGIVHDEGASRFEMRAEGETAYAEYERRGDTVTFTHTIVPPALEGRGIGSALVGAALGWAREAGLKVIPACPFVARHIERHPEERDLLEPGYVRSQQGPEA